MTRLSILCATAAFALASPAFAHGHSVGMSHMGTTTTKSTLNDFSTKYHDISNHDRRHHWHRIQKLEQEISAISHQIRQELRWGMVNPRLLHKLHRLEAELSRYSSV